MKNKKHLSIIVLVLFVVTAVFLLRVQAADSVVLVPNTDADITPYPSPSGSGQNLRVTINDIKPGKRITGIEYCEKVNETACDDENNWSNVTTDEPVNEFASGTGNDDMEFHGNIPNGEIMLRVNFTDFEPMDISYANFTRTDDYHDGNTLNLDHYDQTFEPLITDYKGGDIILPSDCLANGCVLNVTLTDADFAAYKGRIDDINSHSGGNDQRTLVDLAMMWNHLPQDIEDANNVANVIPNNFDTNVNPENDIKVVQNNNGTKSVFVSINKYFNVTSRTEFNFGGNKNRILSEDYIGLKSRIDRKYFPEGNDYGAIVFNDYNHNKASLTMFYGAPEVYLYPDTVKTAVGTPVNMGTINYTYDTIESKDNSNFPITKEGNMFKLGISSFYEQDYAVPLVFKTGDSNAKEVTLNLERYAFMGNGGEVLPIDEEGRNCNFDPQSVCNDDDHVYASTTYKARIDTFYANNTELDATDLPGGKTVELRKDYGFDLMLDEYGPGSKFYARNEEFNPWAVAIFYSEDIVMFTRSFDLGNAVKVTGFTNETISDDMVNGQAKRQIGDEFVTVNDYDNTQYQIFGYGHSFEKPIGTIKYFKESDYNDPNGIDYQIRLATKKELESNGITKVALFLTNGELKPDDENFPELTYGVGEGKIFVIDNRTFDRIGGNN